MEIRLLWSTDSIIAELRVAKNMANKIYRFTNPRPLLTFVEMFYGFDSLQVFDRNREEEFHRDFGRYRVEFFIDDPFSFDADRVEMEDLG